MKTKSHRFDKAGMFRLIADKIEADLALLQVGLHNVARWISHGADQQHRLREWEAMILQARATPSGMQKLLLVEPISKEIAATLTEALGQESLFSSTKGYHADILHPTNVEGLPPGWADRLVQMEGLENVFALEPLDLATVKVVFGREKDLALVRGLLDLGKITFANLRVRLHSMPLGKIEMFRAGRNLTSLTPS